MADLDPVVKLKGRLDHILERHALKRQLMKYIVELGYTVKGVSTLYILGFWFGRYAGI